MEAVRALSEKMDERDRLYKERDEFRRVAVDAALIAAKEQVQVSFEASEKAIVKAENAQREYNIRSNEFRGQLDDQAKRLISRDEVVLMFKGQEEKNIRYDTDIRQLREALAAGSGSKAGSREVLSDSRAWVSLVISAVGLLMAIALAVASFVIGKAS